MPRERVTSELHDSYFRLTTIKHAIPKFEWVIKWSIELLYNSVRTGSQRVGGQMSLKQDVVKKATTQQKGPWGPPMEFGDPLVTRCGRESPHPAEWASGPPVEQPWRTRKTQH